MDVLQWLRVQSRRLNEFADLKLADAEKRLADADSRVVSCQWQDTGPTKPPEAEQNGG